MRRKRGQAALVLSLVCALSGCGTQGQGTQKETTDPTAAVTRDLFAMDTYITMQAYGERAEEALDAAVLEIEQLEKLLSISIADSEVAVVNESGSAYVSDVTALLLERSLELYEETDGAFDITVYPLKAEWGFIDENYQVPEQERIEQLLQYVDASAISFDEEEQFLSLPDNVQIDLGGIVKGYACDRLAEIFEEYDLTAGLVSLGGDVRTYRCKPDGSPFKVAVQNPDLNSEDSYIGILEAEDAAILTSGSYERYFEQDGQVWHHILDPSTGYPARSGLTSVTVVSKDGILADGLATALFVMGKEKALQYWRENTGKLDVIFVEEDGSITITEGIEEIFTSDFSYTVERP